MSEDIRFRAWDRLTNRMLGHEYLLNYKSVFKTYGDAGRLMRFTGLYDSNCNEIYENDIVVIDGHQYLIKLEIGSFMLVRCSGETDMYNQFKECWNDDVYPLSQYYWNDDSEEDTIHSLKIIGNTYENPGLLEAN